MLKTMRRLVDSWPVKLLLIVLILSFGVWGVADMIRAGGSSSAVATIGGQPIPREAFQRAYRNADENARAMLGKDYSPELMRMMGLERQVLDQMIANELMQREAASLGISPPDASVATLIRSDPAFTDAKGQFSRSQFDAALSRAGRTEASYVEGLKREQAVALLRQAVTLRMPVSDAMTAGLARAAAEERAADLIVVNAPPKLNPADDAALEAYYKAHAEAFAAPEYRRLHYAAISTDALAASVAVPEEELKAAYEERAAMFKGGKVEPYETVKPSLEKELRPAHAEEAAAALTAKLSDLLAGGATLQEVAEQLHMSVAALGPVDQGGLTPEGGKATNIPAIPGLLDTAFSLEEGADSGLRKADAKTYYIVKVDAITPAQARPFAQVRAKVAEAWRAAETDKAQAADAQALAAVLHSSPDPAADIAKRGVKVISSGKLARNASHTGGLTLPPQLVAELFTLPPGKTGSAYRLKEGGYVIARLTARTPAAPPGKDALQHQHEALEAAMRKEILQAYDAYLRAKYRVTVNDAALSALVDNAGQ